MGLNNSQYDAIMRQYSKRQLEAARLLEEHRRKAYGKIPQLSQIDSQVSSESLAMPGCFFRKKGGKPISPA